MGQGRTVHFFIAGEGEAVEEVGEVEERREVAIGSVGAKEQCPLRPERHGTQRPLHNSSCGCTGDRCYGGAAIYFL